MSIIKHETPKVESIDWFTKSMYSDKPDCILIASLREDTSLESLEELNTEFLYGNCLDCVHYSNVIDPHFLCDKHKMLCTDENSIVKSRFELLIVNCKN